MSEASERSDVSRSGRAYTRAMETAGTISTSSEDHGRSSTIISSSNLLGAVASNTTTKMDEGEFRRSQDISVGESEERIVRGNSGPINSSWEEPRSFDEGDERGTHSNRPSSRTHIRDRRKQFDATTPTLIDEEDDSEILSLDHSRVVPVSYEKDESSIRRTPGASMYKSSFEPTPEEVANMRKTPGASAMHRSAVSLPQSIPSPYQQQSAPKSNQKESVGLGFGLTLSTPVGVGSGSDPQDPTGKARQQHSVWEPSFCDPSLSNTSVVNPVRSSETASAHHSDSYRPSIRSSLSGNSASSIGSIQTQEIRGPFSFAPWAKTVREESHITSQNSNEGRQGTTGAFSPNILRLTEDIGNLLQEDEDDDFALEIPSVFRADHLSEAGSLNEDWTGAYVFDSEAGRKAAKPAVPSRSSSSSVNVYLHKDGKTRRRSTITNNAQFQTQQQFPSFLPNAQQPKPRIRSSNEVFEFGKSSHSDSPQVLNFGGAFAPPSSMLIGNPNQMRFSPSPFQGELGGLDPQQGRIHQYSTVQNQSNSFGSARGTFQAGLASNNSIPGNTRSFDAYQQNTNTQGDLSGVYFQPQTMLYPPGSANAAYRLPSNMSYSAHQSEMQATAREFVPRTTASNVQYTQHPDWQTRMHSTSLSPYDIPTEQSNWHSTNASYGYNMSYGYGMTQQQGFSQQNFVDPRTTLTPSPHLASWQHPMHMAQQHHLIQQQQQQPPVQQAPPVQQPQQQLHQLIQTPPPVSDPNLGYASGNTNTRISETGNQMSSSHRGTSSPHPSIAGSEHSQSASQVSKKDPKRKQRGKKKAPKSDSPSGRKGPVSSKKKGSKGDQTRPGSTAQSTDGHEDHQASASEDPNDAKRSELIESSATRAAFKEFYRTIRSEERLSFQKAEEFALQSLTDGSLPESVHWRVYLELADLAKRSNRYVEARRLYKMVCQLQPYASQGWLEYSKLEEECGHMNRVMNILHSGLEYCKYSESLLTRAVKHQEKMGNLATARELLARLKHVGIEKVWRTVLEGALLEARAGNVATARRVLKYLMHHVPWYGPLYLEAYRLEKDQGHPLDALQIVERGLQAIPRYGPLWFGAFRLCEDMDRSKKLFDLPQSMSMIERATVSISKELVWKVHLEAAQMLERSAFEKGSVDDPKFDELLVPARRRLAMTVLTCPNNLRWKVWLAAARMELGIGNTKIARQLFLRAHEVVPKKGRSSTLLESARLEDFIGDTHLARAILCKGRWTYCHDWKVWLESVLLEIRSGNIPRAVEICSNALEVHQGTGRLWATLVQLRQFSGRDEAQQIALRQALNAVPKSGEVWCEGGRIHLNPFSDTFDLARARRHLFFATKFTPQYGDGFVETIRLELIDQWLRPIALFIWEKTKTSFQSSSDFRLENSLTKYITDVSLAIAVASLRDTDKDVSKSSLPKLVHRSIVPDVRKKLRPEVLRDSIDLSDLRLACVNADPNYGLLWFHCRRRPIDTPRRIIEDAAGDIATELQKYAHIYLAAMIRRLAIVSTLESEKPKNVEEGLEITDPITAKWYDYVDERLQAAPSLEEIFNPIDPTTGLVLLENTINGPLFVTGLSELNKHKPMSSLSLTERRRSLFGNDALFP